MPVMYGKIQRNTNKQISARMNFTVFIGFFGAATLITLANVQGLPGVLLELISAEASI